MMSTNARCVRTIARLKPTGKPPVETVLDCGRIKLSLGAYPSKLRPGAVVDHVVRGDTSELMPSLQALLGATIAGQEAVIVMQGGTGSGKSFTLEGGFPAAGGPRQIGLVERLIIQLSTQSTAVTTPSGPACAIRLHLAELTKSEEVVRIHREENFASAAAAIARYRQAARQFNKLQRPDTTATQGRGSDHVAAASMSSRSWTHLILETASHGKLHIYDIPGKEYGGADDKEYINGRYEQLQIGLKALARGEYPRPAQIRSGPAALIDSILQALVRVPQAILIGCVDPKDRVRAQSTLTLLSDISSGTLPAPLPVPISSALVLPAPHALLDDAQYRTIMRSDPSAANTQGLAVVLSRSARPRRSTKVTDLMELPVDLAALDAYCCKKLDGLAKGVELDIFAEAPNADQVPVLHLVLVNNVKLYHLKVCRAIRRLINARSGGQGASELAACLIDSYMDTANLEAERLWDCIMASCPEGALVPFSPMSDWGSEKANESPLSGHSSQGQAQDEGGGTAEVEAASIVEEDGLPADDQEQPESDGKLGVESQD